MTRPDGGLNPSGAPPRSAQPIAIMGMACRFPAEDLPAFWRLLEAGGNAVTEVHPGSGVGRAGELFPDPEAQNKACLLAGGVHSKRTRRHESRCPRLATRGRLANTRRTVP